MTPVPRSKKERSHTTQYASDTSCRTEATHAQTGEASYATATATTTTNATAAAAIGTAASIALQGWVSI